MVGPWGDWVSGLVLNLWIERSHKNMWAVWEGETVQYSFLDFSYQPSSVLRSIFV